jgi:phospholipase C
MAFLRIAAVTSAFLVAACNASGSLSNSPVPPSATALSAVRHRNTTPIKHVIFIVQENRSFNNLFMGFPGATTQNYGIDLKGRKVMLRQVKLAQGWDLDHFSESFFQDCNARNGKLPGTHCKMNGWDNERTGFGAPKHAPYGYLDEQEVDPYWQMAKQYVLADKMFASNLDGSFIAHQYIVAAFASRAVDSPAGAWGCGGTKGDVIPTLTAKRTYGSQIFPCFTNPTIASESDAAGVTWRFYTGPVSGDGGLWNAYQADKAIYSGPDWKNDVITPPSQFLTDIAAGTLENVTWITPTFENSDHPGVNSSTGPAWVASIVNAVGTSKFWDSSAIFIMWDDWGGWFDPVKPVFEDYDGLGFRVPLIMIAPYARQGSVTEVQYETSSVVRFMEDTFGLAPMAASDTRANDPALDSTAFDFTQQPRKFQKFLGSRPNSYWIGRDRSSRYLTKPKSFLGDD